jgi:hypothetical protein
MRLRACVDELGAAEAIRFNDPLPYGQRLFAKIREAVPPRCRTARQADRRVQPAGHGVKGNPDPNHVSTRYAERQNLDIRMGNRRMTLLTKPFQGKPQITRT